MPPTPPLPNSQRGGRADGVPDSSDYIGVEDEHNSDQDESRPLLFTHLAAAARGSRSQPPANKRRHADVRMQHSQAEPSQPLRTGTISAMFGLTVTSLLVILVVLLAQLIGSDKRSQPQPPLANMPYRLSPRVTPSAYVIQIQPDLASLNYSGSVAAIITIKGQPSAVDWKRAASVDGVPAIELFADQETLSIVSVWLKGPIRAANSQARALKVPVDSDYSLPVRWAFSTRHADLLRITPDVPSSPSQPPFFVPGIYLVNITFTGKIGDRTAYGFYRSEFDRESLSFADSLLHSDAHDTADAISYVGVTHFEPLGARTAFPCFDEPSFKATFNVSITLPEPWHARSNAEISVIHSHKRPSTQDTSLVYRTFVFEPTIPMSTYLLCWGISTYSPVSSKTRSGLVINAWVPSGLESHAMFALSAASHAVAAFEAMLNLSLPLTKIDLFPVPDYSSEAMENWGLITIDMGLYLIPPADSPSKQALSALGISSSATAVDIASRLRTALLVAHELAHFWFGDLVTMGWWNDLWLNEGFAEFMQYICVDIITAKTAKTARESLEPVFELPSQLDLLDAHFFTSEHLIALAADASNFTHPISLTVADPSDAPGLFDDISYNKGASVLHMMGRIVEAISTPAASNALSAGKMHNPKNRLLFTALNRYVQSHAFATAGTPDLWASVDSTLAEAGIHTLSIDKRMTPWVECPGFPLLQVHYDSNANVFILRQERFRLSASPTAVYAESKAESKCSNWPVFLTFWTAQGIESQPSQPSFVLMQDSLISIPMPLLVGTANAPEPLILVNLNRIAPFRIAYSSEILQALSKAMATSLQSPTHSALGHNRISATNSTMPAFSASDRAGFVSDLLAVLLSSHDTPVASLSELQTLLDFMKFDGSPAVWKAGLEGLFLLDAALPSSTPASVVFRDWLADLVDAAAGRLGWIANRSQQSAMDIVRLDLLGLAVLSFDCPNASRTGLDLFNRITDQWFTGSKTIKRVNVPSNISLDLLTVIIGAGISNSPHSVFDRFMALISQHQHAGLSYPVWLAIVKGMTATASPDRRTILLDHLHSQSLPSTSIRIRPQDRLVIYDSLRKRVRAGGHTGLWIWLRSRWETIVMRYANGHEFARILEQTVALFSDAVMLNDAALIAKEAQQCSSNSTSACIPKNLVLLAVMRGLERANASRLVLRRLGLSDQ